MPSRAARARLSDARTRETIYILSKEGAASAAPLTTALTVAIAEAMEERAERNGGRLDLPARSASSMSPISRSWTVAAPSFSPPEHPPLLCATTVATLTGPLQPSRQKHLSRCSARSRSSCTNSCWRPMFAMSMTAAPSGAWSGPGGPPLFSCLWLRCGFSFPRRTRRRLGTWWTGGYLRGRPGSRLAIRESRATARTRHLVVVASRTSGVTPHCLSSSPGILGIK